MKLDFAAWDEYRIGVLLMDVCPVRRLLSFCVAFLVASSVFGAPVISEFMASNSSGLTDEDGAFSDWIEISNPDAVPISLAGYFLTDRSTYLRRWMFPSVSVDPGAFLVVFASGKNRTDPAGRLHTNFKLSAEGGYLGVVAPDGVSVVSDFAPAYPPQFDNRSFGLGQGATPVWYYYSPPTPGTANGAGTRAGPIVQATEPNPPQPVTGPLTLSVRTLPVNGPVSEVRLYYRKMFTTEAVIAMHDDGTGGDATAGDGIWTAAIPATAFSPGQMTRWRFVALDSSGAQTKEPPYPTPLDSAQYFGTVSQDPRIRTALTVLHWFTSNPGGADTLTGSRGAVYYEGEFYDNVLFSMHGQSSSGFPKKSYNVDFNRAQRFRWSTNAPRVADIDILTNWGDKSKVRHVLAYEVMRRAGVATHFAYTARIQQNGNFFSTADMVEDADEIYLERAGLNPDGVLYKVNDNLLNKDIGNTGNSGVEKKTRKFETNSDLQELINGLDLTGTALKNFIYDNIDIPACVNMLAANSVIRNTDLHRKNWYIYRDTGRSGEWAMLPWDLDLSFGRAWNTQDEYFDSALYFPGFVVTGDAIRLVSQLFGYADTKAMIMRRIRTLCDEFLQPPPAPGTPEQDLFLERRLNEQSLLIDPPDIVPSDAQLDFQKWGSWLQGGGVVPYTNTNIAVESMAEAVQRWKIEYLPARRAYIYNTQIVGTGGQIPLPQVGGPSTTNFTPLVVSGAAARALVPTNGNLRTNWTGDPFFEPISLAGWLSGTTGVGYERASGYEGLIGLNVNEQMRSNNSIYIRVEFNVADPAAFDRLELRMKVDDGFVAYLNGAVLASANAPAAPQWDSAALVSREANPYAFTVFDVTSQLPKLRVGKNILAIHGLNDSLTSSDMLILPELHGGKVIPPSNAQPKLTFGAMEVSPASGNQDEEFIQIRNTNSIAVDISGWRLTGGIEHLFPGGTVLPAWGSIYICPNAATFRSRTVSPKGGEGLLVQGGYRGHLASSGETVVLLTPSGDTNIVMSYVGQPSDAQRYLVISELMYHPSGDGLAEFVEVMNISPSVSVNLKGVRFTKGVEFDFGGAGINSLGPGRRLVVVRDLEAFHRVYGTNRPIAGVFLNGTSLSNSGEVIKLEDVEAGTIREFAYSDQPPWPVGADSGFSLVLVQPETNPDPALPASWRASDCLGGNPGWPDVPGYPADPAGDSDGNGERDLIDYAFGNHVGLQPVPATLTVQPGAPGESATVRLSYPSDLDARNVELGVEYSTDTADWHDAAQYLEFISKESLEPNRELTTWRVKAPLDAASRLFLRFRATPR